MDNVMYMLIKEEYAKKYRLIFAGCAQSQAELHKELGMNNIDAPMYRTWILDSDEISFIIDFNKKIIRIGLNEGFEIEIPFDEVEKLY